MKVEEYAKGSKLLICEKCFRDYEAEFKTASKSRLDIYSLV